MATTHGSMTTATTHDDRVYFSASNPTGCGCLATVVQEPTLSVASDSEYIENKACVTSETAVAPLLPNHALEAFKMLKIPEVQSVVCSLVSDERVYNAVMQNEKVMEFFQSQKITGAHPNVMNIDVNEPLVETLFQNQESSVKIEDMSEAKHSESSGNGFKGFVHNIKLTVVEMVKNLSGFFQNIFGDPAAENVPGDANRNAKETYVDSVVGASSFMALAVLVIMVIFLKRG